MTCHTHIDAVAAERQQLLAWDRHTDSAGQQYGPAETTETPQSNGGLPDMIERRFRKQYPHNDLRRRRAISLHMTLARGIYSEVSND